MVIPDAAQRQLHLLQKGSPARDGDGQGGVVEIGFSTIVDGLCGDPVGGGEAGATNAKRRGEARFAAGGGVV